MSQSENPTPVNSTANVDVLSPGGFVPASIREAQDTAVVDGMIRTPLTDAAEAIRALSGIAQGVATDPKPVEVTLREPPKNLEEAIERISHLEGALAVFEQQAELRLTDHTQKVLQIVERHMLSVQKLYNSDAYFDRVTNEVLKRLEAIDSLSEGRLEARLSHTQDDPTAVQVVFSEVEGVRKARGFAVQGLAGETVEVTLPPELEPLVMAAAAANPEFVNGVLYWLTFHTQPKPAEA